MQVPGYHLPDEVGAQQIVNNLQDRYGGVVYPLGISSPGIQGVSLEEIDGFPRQGVFLGARCLSPLTLKSSRSQDM